MHLNVFICFYIDFFPIKFIYEVQSELSKPKEEKNLTKLLTTVPHVGLVLAHWHFVLAHWHFVVNIISTHWDTRVNVPFKISSAQLEHTEIEMCKMQTFLHKNPWNTVFLFYLLCFNITVLFKFIGISCDSPSCFLLL